MATIQDDSRVCEETSEQWLENGLNGEVTDSISVDTQCSWQHRSHFKSHHSKHVYNPQGNHIYSPVSGQIPAATQLGQHVVLLHINPGETISFQIGDQIQLIQGPATVKMVSNSNTPPVAVPVQVPPGHMVQQIVDENGTLRHIILSPQPPVAMPVSAQYTPAAVSANNTPPFFPYTQGSYPSQYHSIMQPALSSSAGQPSGAHGPHKDERAQKQHFKLRKKLESRGSSNVTSANHGSNFSRQGNVSQMSEKESDATEEETAENVGVISFLSNISAPELASSSTRSAVVSWNPPQNVKNSSTGLDVNVPLSELLYELLLSEMHHENKETCIKCNNAVKHELVGLKPATEYFVRIQTSWNKLKGTPSSALKFSTNCSEPDTPQPPKLAARTKNSLSLKWNAPCDNGSKITSYILESDQGKDEQSFEEVYRGPLKQFKLVKLVPATSYNFRLAVLNSVGKSGFSVSRFSTCGSAPSQPEPPKIVDVGVHSITLEWSVRQSDDSFTLQIEQEGSQHGFLPIYNGQDNSFTCRELQRNTKYRIRLSAHNDEGNSPFSSIVCSQTLSDKPRCPERLSVRGKVSSSGFTIGWAPPLDDGGCPVNTYFLEMDSGSGFQLIYEGAQMEHSVSKLEPGTTYRLQAYCKTTGGVSEHSDALSVTTSPVCPGKCEPPQLQGKPKPLSVHLKWAPPNYDGGAPVTEHEILVESPDGNSRSAYKGPNNDCVVAGLLPGRMYTFKLRAFNSVGPSSWSEPLEVHSGAGPPEPPPCIRTANRSAHVVLIDWDEPENNGSPLTEYSLEYSKDKVSFQQLCCGPTNQFEARNLTFACTYYFRVQAINSCGASSFSETIVHETPPGPPGPISTSSIKWVATHVGIEMSWQAPASNGAEISKYYVEMGTAMYPAETNHFVISSLQPETVYRVRVQAVNSVGPGPYSSTVKITTKALPPNPPALDCIGTTHSSLKLKWGDGKNIDLIQYTLEMEYKPGLYAVVYQGTGHSYKVSRLQEATTYQFRIQAASEAGEGPYSPPYSFVTNRALPPALKAPKVIPLSETECRIEWNPVKAFCDDAVSYIVQVQLNFQSEFSVVYRGPETSCLVNSLCPDHSYSARVAAVRHCQDGTGDLTGAFSPPTIFSMQLPKSTNITSSIKHNPSLEKTRQPLTDQQWAGILVGGFTLLAVLVAVLLERLVSWSQAG